MRNIHPFNNKDNKWRKETHQAEDKWKWIMMLEHQFLRMIRMTGQSSITIGKTSSMKIETLKKNMILTLDISRITDQDKWMTSLKIKGSIITLHRKDWITKSNRMMMGILIRNINNMKWNKLWIYMEMMIIIITSMKINHLIKITLITMMILKISLFLSMSN